MHLLISDPTKFSSSSMSFVSKMQPIFFPIALANFGLAASFFYPLGDKVVQFMIIFQSFYVYL